MELILGLDNIFDWKYAPNIAANVRWGRSFEPGVGRRICLGVMVGGAGVT